MHELQNIATDVPYNSVFVSQSVTCLLTAKTAAKIDVVFGLKTLEEPRDIAFDCSPDFSHRFCVNNITIM